jgi:hypothetical protein
VGLQPAWITVCFGPQVYLSAIISLLPKQTTVEKLLPLGELSDDELVMIEEMLASSRARLVQQPERQNGLC